MSHKSDLVRRLSSRFSLGFDMACLCATSSWQLVMFRDVLYGEVSGEAEEKKCAFNVHGVVITNGDNVVRVHPESRGVTEPNDSRLT